MERFHYSAFLLISQHCNFSELRSLESYQGLNYKSNNVKHQKTSDMKWVNLLKNNVPIIKKPVT